MDEMLDYTDFDRDIWERELEGFVPDTVVDVHAHCWNDAYAGTNDGPPEKGMRYPGGYRELKAHADEIFPGRRNGFNLLAVPVPGMDYLGFQKYMGAQVRENPLHLGSTAVVPAMTAAELDAAVRQYRFTGLKPYRLHAADPANCRIRDYLPEAQIEVANEHGLTVTMHLSRFDGAADKHNQQDLRELTAKYPKVRWILAHCARGFNPYTLEESVFVLRDIPNLWYDLSAVCSARSQYLLLKHERLERLLYGTDNIIAGLDHGSYITWGRGWSFFRGGPMSHCEGAATMVVYEQLRCIRQAADMAGLSKSDIEAVFWRNAANFFGFRKEDIG